MTGILLLQEQPRTSTAVARQFEVSKRTVMRDIQALCEIGVPIVACEGAAGGYELPAGYTLAPLQLNTREALLLLALDTITRMADAPFAAAQAGLLAKLRALLPQSQLAEAERLRASYRDQLPCRLRRSAPFHQLCSVFPRCARKNAHKRIVEFPCCRRQIGRIVMRNHATA